MDPKYEATLKHARDLEQFVQELQMQVNLKNAEISTLKNSQAFRYKEKKEPALPERAPDAHDITSMTPDEYNQYKYQKKEEELQHWKTNVIQLKEEIEKYKQRISGLEIEKRQIDGLSKLEISKMAVNVEHTRQLLIEAKAKKESEDKKKSEDTKALKAILDSTYGSKEFKDKENMARLKHDYENKIERLVHINKQLEAELKEKTQKVNELEGEADKTAMVASQLSNVLNICDIDVSTAIQDDDDEVSVNRPRSGLSSANASPPRPSNTAPRLQSPPTREFQKLKEERDDLERELKTYRAGVYGLYLDLQIKEKNLKDLRAREAQWKAEESNSNSYLTDPHELHRVLSAAQKLYDSLSPTLGIQVESAAQGDNKLGLLVYKVAENGAAKEIKQGYKILGINNVKVQNASEFGAQFSRIRPGVSCNLEVTFESKVWSILCDAHCKELDLPNLTHVIRMKEGKEIYVSDLKRIDQLKREVAAFKAREQVSSSSSSGRSSGTVSARKSSKKPSTKDTRDRISRTTSPAAPAAALSPDRRKRSDSAKRITNMVAKDPISPQPKSVVISNSNSNSRENQLGFGSSANSRKTFATNAVIASPDSTVSPKKRPNMKTDVRAIVNKQMRVYSNSHSNLIEGTNSPIKSPQRSPSAKRASTRTTGSSDSFMTSPVSKTPHNNIKSPVETPNSTSMQTLSVRRNPASPATPVSEALTPRSNIESIRKKSLKELSVSLQELEKYNEKLSTPSDAPSPAAVAPAETTIPEKTAETLNAISDKKLFLSPNKTSPRRYSKSPTRPTDMKSPTRPTDLKSSTRPAWNNGSGPTVASAQSARRATDGATKMPKSPPEDSHSVRSASAKRFTKGTDSMAERTEAATPDKKDRTKKSSWSSGPRTVSAPLSTVGSSPTRAISAPSSKGEQAVVSMPPLQEVRQARSPSPSRNKKLQSSKPEEKSLEESTVSSSALHELNEHPKVGDQPNGDMERQNTSKKSQKEIQKEREIQYSKNLLGLNKVGKKDTTKSWSEIPELPILQKKSTKKSEKNVQNTKNKNSGNESTSPTSTITPIVLQSKASAKLELQPTEADKSKPDSPAADVKSDELAPPAPSMTDRIAPISEPGPLAAVTPGNSTLSRGSATGDADAVLTPERAPALSVDTSVVFPVAGEADSKNTGPLTQQNLVTHIPSNANEVVTSRAAPLSSDA